MHFPADAMSGKLVDRSESVRFGVALDRVAHIAQPVAGNTLLRSFPEAFLGYPDQLLRFRADGSDPCCESGVGLPAVKQQCAVY